MKRFVLVFLVQALVTSALASDRIYGWELEFTNSKVWNAEYGKNSAHANAVNDAARDKWLKIVKQYCKQTSLCRIKEIEGWVSWYKKNGETVWSWEVESYRVQFNDGFWFNLSYDCGVVEVQMTPSTVAGLERNETRIQQAVFDTALKAGLKPRKEKETHLHTGAEAAFKGKLALFRNFLVDAVNHPEFTHLFSKGLHNAPPLMLLPEKQYDKFAEIISAVDSGAIKTQDELVKRIRKQVYNVTYDADMVNVDDPTQKYQAWNLERMTPKFKPAAQTVENRSVPHPANARDMLLVTRLQDSRIAYLEGLGATRIELEPYQPKLSVKERVAKFSAYIKESGLNPKDYLHFLRRACERTLLVK